MNKPTQSKCSRCSELEAQLAAVQGEIAQLREQLAAAKKTSATSSKPPSSDIVKPRSADALDEESKRKIGGQPGHPKHERELFSTEQISKSQVHSLSSCPDCGAVVLRNGQLERVIQQIDIEPTPLTIEQHTCPEYWCQHCQKPCWAPFPKHIEKGGLTGPKLTALIAFMKGFCHASYSTIRKYLRDVVGVTVSRGHLANVISKVSDALEGSYEELLDLLPMEAVLNVDETGHKNNGDRWWTWCFRADLYTLYHIDQRRSADVLTETLGKDFDGVIGCDYFSAYRRYMREMNVVVQFCMAHLIRDVKFITKLPNAEERAYGERVRLALKQMFAVIHRREEMSADEFVRQLQVVRDRVLLAGMSNVPATRYAQNLAKRFRDHGASYFTFITTPEVGPTNNLAEQAIRFVVIDRLITQGTRSETGRKWSERIWTVIATCVQQSRNLLEFIQDTVDCWFIDKATPSLRPAKTTC
jgi:transposase